MATYDQARAPLTGEPLRTGDATALNTPAQSGVSWGAILAGAVAASALSLIMLLLGAGTGLGIASPWSGEGAEARTIGIGAIFWITFTQVAASGLGGYLAGRLRTKWSGLHTDEAGFRDTAHGFLAWGVATLVTSALLMSAVGSTLSAGARAGMGMVGGVASSAASAAGIAAAGSSGDEGGSSGPMGYWVDALVRKDPAAASPASAPAPAPTPAATATTGTETTSTGMPVPAPAPAPATAAAPSQAAPMGSTAELGRILANSLRTGNLPAEDSRYAAQVVAQRAGISQQDAEKRVTDTYNRAKAALDETKNKAIAAADAARKTTSYGALWIFISLVIGALVAAYCASVGGRARDL